MHYYNDITQMRGDEADAVDVIIGGSPCQDLSVAGARAITNFLAPPKKRRADNDKTGEKQ